MNMSGMLRFALGLANVPDDKVADLDNALPGLSRMALAAKELRPILIEMQPHLAALEPMAVEAWPHLEALAPLFAKAWPTLQKAWPDIVATAPTLEELIDMAIPKGSAR